MVGEAMGQISVFGKVSDEDNLAVPLCRVIVKNSQDSYEILDYVFTDINGLYLLEIPTTNSFHIQFSATYYLDNFRDIKVEQGQLSIEVNATLMRNPIKLENVILETTQPVIVKKDTIVYRVDHFRRGDEQVLEDLLDNIPGIEVSPEGTVKVENKEIEKIMIEGSDLVGEDYKLLSKNMPDYPIEEVELYRNYQENHLLRDVFESDDFALNINLGAEYKAVWFGNIKPKTDLGINSRYDVASNLFGIFNKTQTYITSELNSIGSTSSVNSRSLANTDVNSEVSRLDQLVKIGTFNTGFGNTNFNNLETISLNSVFSSNDKINTRLQVLFNLDEQSFIRSINRKVEIDDISFENNEKYNLNRETQGWASRANIRYSISDNQLLVTNTSYTSNNLTSQMNFDFNDLQSFESLSLKEQFFSQNIDYTLKISDRNVLQANLFYAHETKPQDYNTNRNLFDSFFEDSSITKLAKSIENKMDSFTYSVLYTNKNKRKNLWNIEFSGILSKEYLNLLPDFDFEEFPFTENSDYSIWESQINVSRKFTSNKMEVSPIVRFNATTISLNSHPNQNRLTNNSITGGLSAKWLISEYHTTRLNYIHSIDPISDISSISSGYILVDRNTLKKGIGSLDFMKKSSYNFSYSISNPAHRIALKAGISYNIFHDYLTIAQKLTQNFQINELVLVEDQTSAIFFSTTDYFISEIFTNIKLNLSYSTNDYIFFLESEENGVESNTYGLGVEIRTTALDQLDVIVGTRFVTPRVIVNEISRPDINSSSQFFDLIWNPTEQITLKTVFDRSAYISDNRRQSFYFINLHYDQVLVKNKLNYGIEITNLINEDVFTTVNASNYGIITSQFRLQPRIVMLKLEYRF